MRMIKAQAGRFRHEHIPSHAMRRDIRRAFFGRTIYFHRDKLPVPVKLFRGIGIVIDIDNSSLPLLEPQQRPRELAIITNGGDNMLRAYLYQTNAYPDGIVG